MRRACWLVLVTLGATALGQEEGSPRRPGPATGGLVPPAGDRASRALVRALDKNADGKLSPDEIDLAVVALRKLDRNGDGSIGGEEFLPAGDSGRPAVTDGRRERERPDGRRPGGGRGGDGEIWRALAERYDKDRNGEISKAEYTRGGEKFAQLDRNRDGRLSAEDFRGGRGGRGGTMGVMVNSRLVRMADDDADSEVTEGEWKKFVASVKTGDDGKIEKGNLEERLREGGAGRMAPRMIEFLDRNGDSELAKEELHSAWVALDRDRDGVIKGSEFGRPGGPGNGRGGAGGRPEVGEVAPDFALPYAAKDGAPQDAKKARLSTFKGDKPVALVFGSYT